MKKKILEKIRKKEINVGVVGLGYVGLPLAVEKAKAGFKTIGFDVQKAKVDLDEFLMQCRIGGYFDLNELQMVVLETNGSLSFFPKEKYRPTVVNDLNIKINKVNPPTLLVKEGTIFHENLKSINHDVDWLERELNVLGVPLSDIILMYQEDNSNLGVYTINEIEKKFN